MICAVWRCAHLSRPEGILPLSGRAGQVMFGQVWGGR
jgi:hypothetical protein